ncbi:MAG: hypothetical protein ACYDCC_00150 [Actinomycetota bacterium]
MRRLFIPLLVLLTSCSGFSTPAPTSSNGKPPDVTLLIQNLTLTLNAPTVIEVDDATPAISLIVSHDPAAHIDTYLISSASSKLPKPCGVSSFERRDCVRDIGDGVRETLQADPGNRGKAVAILLRSGSPTIDLKFIYAEGSRSIELRIPEIAPWPGDAACKDNGCNPFIEMMPLRNGMLHSVARFSGSGTLRCEEGRIIGRSFTATGIPYRPLFEQSGATELSGSSPIDAQSEVALELINTNASVAMTSIDLKATWP